MSDLSGGARAHIRAHFAADDVPEAERLLAAFARDDHPARPNPAMEAAASTGWRAP